MEYLANLSLVNCGIFRDVQANGNGLSDIVPGICTNILKFYNLRGIQNTDTMTLTWDGANALARQTFVCGVKGPFCVTQNAIYERVFNLPSGTLGITSCDEYPFAGTEEGGSYFGTLQSNPTSSAATCVPAYQQNIQGSCNSECRPSLLGVAFELTASSELLSGLSTNVAYADGGSSATPVWQLWGGGGAKVQPSWTQITTPWQRLVLYPQQIPAADNVGAVFDSLSNHSTHFFIRSRLTSSFRPTAPLVHTLHRHGEDIIKSATLPPEWCGLQALQMAQCEDLRRFVPTSSILVVVAPGVLSGQMQQQLPAR